MEVLYAFMRYTDDLVDSSPDQSAEEKFALLDDWQSALDRTFGEPSSQNEPSVEIGDTSLSLAELVAESPHLPGVRILPAVRYFTERFGIPKQVFSEALLGARSDIEQTRFQEFEDCADYCHQVATSVGVASLAIWGTKEPLFSAGIVKAAKACGIAIQLTNIVRDILEDERNGRFYLPLQELARVGLTENQLISLIEYENFGKKRDAKRKSPEDAFAEREFQSQAASLYGKFDRFIDKELDRIETHFFVAARLYESIDRDARRSFGMIWDAYYRLFRKIRRNPRKILSCKTRLSLCDKLRLFARWTFFPPKKLQK